MAKKTTMKRKMKKRGTRRCWGGGQESKIPKTPVTKSSPRIIKKPTEKGEEYAKKQLQNTLRQQYNKHMKTKVDDLTEAFDLASISSTPK